MTKRQSTPLEALAANLAREASVSTPFVDAVVRDVLDAHGLGRRIQPLCPDCHVEMRHITSVVNGDLYQCLRCKRLEVR